MRQLKTPSTPAEFREAAEHIREQATRYREADQQHAQPASFWLGSWQVKCRPTRTAVLALADRIAKGVPSDARPPSTPRLNTSLRQAFPQSAFDRLVADGDAQAAIELADMAGLPVYFAVTFGKPTAICSPKLQADERFVSGRLGRTWSVTHLGSGMSVGRSGHATRAAAEAAYTKARQLPQFNEFLERYTETKAQAELRNTFFNPQVAAAA